MGKKVSYSDRAINLPSWSIPISTIVKIETDAEKMGIKPSNLLRIMIALYYETLSNENLKDERQ